MSEDTVPKTPPSKGPQDPISRYIARLLAGGMGVKPNFS
jgi:hypothetical protein